MTAYCPGTLAHNLVGVGVGLGADGALLPPSEDRDPSALDPLGIHNLPDWLCVPSCA